MIEITLAELHVAEHALREEPYERLPCLAGTIAVAQAQIENLRQEVMRLKLFLERVERALEGLEK